MDRAARTLVLSVNRVPLSYAIGRGVRNWGDVHTGDDVRATITEVLTLYLAPANGRGRPPDAHVLVVYPSYRLLKVQYANGGTGTFKVGLHMRMKGIEAGDAVTIHPVAVTKLRLRRHSNATSAN